MKNHHKKILRLLILSIVLIGFSSFLQVSIQWIKGIGIDFAMEKDSRKALFCLFGLMGLILFKSLSHYYYTFIFNIYKSLSLGELRSNLMRTLLRFPYNEFTKKKTSDYQTLYAHKISLLEMEYYNSIYGLNQIIFECVFAILSMIVVDPRIAGIVTPFLFLPAFLPEVAKKQITKVQDNYNYQYQLSLALLNDYIEGFEVIKNYGAEGFALKKLKTINLQLEKASVSKDFLAVITNIISMILSNITLIVSVIFSGYYIIKGKITFGDFIIINSLLEQVQTQIPYVSSYLHSIFSARVIIRELKDFCDFSPKNPSGEKIFEEVNKIQLNHVTRRYGDSIVINDINLEIRPGFCLIQGKSGSGKTTLVNTLMYDSDLDGGEIRINDIKINNISNLVSIITIARQEPVFFKISLEENLTMFNPGKRDQMIALLNQFGLEKYSKDESLKKIVFDEIHFSGGELKRLSLIRTLLTDAPIFIFDEPFENLDPISLEKVKEVIFSIKDKIVIIVSHLFEEDFDRYQEIYSLQEGKGVYLKRF